MKSGITRWNARPSKYGVPVTHSLVFGSFHGRVPRARPTNDAHVRRRCSADRSQAVGAGSGGVPAGGLPGPARPLVAPSGGKAPVSGSGPFLPLPGGGLAPPFGASAPSPFGVF